jgi:four helix bundle protein
MFIKNAEDLAIYQIALKLASEITRLVKQIPYHWDIAECNQVFRSSSSVHSNIAEGFAQRFYPKQFIKYLYIAMGSSDETKNHIKKLCNDHHIELEVTSYYIGKYKNLSVRIVNFVSYLRKRHDIKTLP